MNHFPGYRVSNQANITGRGQLLGYSVYVSRFVCRGYGEVALNLVCVLVIKTKGCIPQQDKDGTQNWKAAWLAEKMQRQ